MKRVRVLKFCGETGLRRIGTEYLEYDASADRLSSLGIVEILKPTDDPVKKELKIKRETKELKTTRETKGKRGPKKRK
jgi:hypothetical protein